MKTCFKSDTIKELKLQIWNVSDFINETEDKLKDNAKSLLSAAKNILDKMDNKNPELAKAISILEDTQVALGTNISESKELKGLSEQKFNEVIVTINNENKKREIKTKQLSPASISL